MAMNSSDDTERDATDERLRRALRALPTPATPPGLQAHVQSRLRNRQVARGAAIAGIPAGVLMALFLWQPWRGEAVVPVPQPVAESPREIPADDLAVLFAPPPVDSLDLLARRDAVSIAAISRMEGEK
jgi:hypothetical protein